MFHLSCWDAFEELEGGQNLTELFKPYVPEHIAYASTGAIWSTDATWLMEQGADLVGVARVGIAHPDWAQGLGLIPTTIQNDPRSLEKSYFGRLESCVH